jgi:hypothetical protein
MPDLQINAAGGLSCLYAGAFTEAIHLAHQATVAMG